MKKLSLLFLLFALSASAQTWNNQMVADGNINSNRAIVYASDNTPRIIYMYNSNMFFAKPSPNGWVTNQIGGGCSYVYAFTEGDMIYVYHHYSSFPNGFARKKINFQGELLADTTLFTDYILNNVSISKNTNYIAFCYSNYNGLWLKKLNIASNIFEDRSIDATGSNGSCYLDDDNTTWVCYRGQGGGLKVAKIPLNSEQLTWNVIEGNIANPQIWLDNNDIPQIIYYDNDSQNLKYATFNP